MRWLFVLLQAVALAFVALLVFIGAQLFPDFAFAIGIAMKAIVILALLGGFVVATSFGWNARPMEMVCLLAIGVGFILLPVLMASANGSQWLDVLRLNANASFSQYVALGYGVVAGAATAALRNKHWGHGAPAQTGK